MVRLARRDPVEMVGPPRLSGVVARPLNFTVRRPSISLISAVLRQSPLTRSFRSSLAVGLLASAGCVSVEHYPSSWGDKPTGGQCTSVTGTYENKGLRADGVSVLLAAWLNPTLKSNSPERFQVASDLIHAQTVEVNLAGTLLSINAVGADTNRSWTLDSSKGQFECREGVIRIARWHVDNDIVVLANKDSIDLYRTQEFLLVNVHGGGAGFAMVVPVAGYSSAWARFPVRAEAHR